MLRGDILYHPLTALPGTFIQALLVLVKEANTAFETFIPTSKEVNTVILGLY